MKQYDGDYRFWVNISLEKVIVLVKIMRSKHKKSTVNSCVTCISRCIAHTHTHAGTPTRLYTSYIENIAIPDAKLHPLVSHQDLSDSPVDALCKQRPHALCSTLQFHLRTEIFGYIKPPPHSIATLLLSSIFSPSPPCQESNHGESQIFNF